jgi:4'-phosphopantetheinyl transferase
MSALTAPAPEPLPEPRLGRLDAGEIDVWYVPLDARYDLGRLRRGLDAGERSRADRLIAGGRARRFIVAHAALRMILADYVGRSPDSLRFRAGSWGKPWLVGAGQLQFSLSHSGELAAVAVTSGPAVGVDVEACLPRRVNPGLLRLALTEREQAVLRRKPAGSRAQAFFRMWTAKEAALKAWGVGLQGGLRKLEVSLGEGDRLGLSPVGAAIPPLRWWAVSLSPAPGYEGALVSQAPVRSLSPRWWPAAVR